MNPTISRAYGLLFCLFLFSHSHATPLPPPDWTALGSGLSNFARASAIDQAGNVYAGGGFTQAGGVSANRIARWDGTNWSALGTGLSGSCNAIAAKTPNEVYAGGTFTQAGGTNVSNIARWNGTSWQALGSGLNGECLSLVLDKQGNLYAGGFFTQAGGNTVNYISKWDGTSWQALGTGLNARCEAIAIDSAGNVYAGGYLTQAGGTPASYIAKWDGTSWSAMGSGFNNTVQALGVSPAGEVYAGGTFSFSGANPRSRIARWDGTSWVALGSGLNGTCFEIAFNNAGDLLAGGGFTTAGGSPATLVAQWDGTTWSAIGSGLSFGSGVYGIVVNVAGFVFAAGQFTNSGTTTGINHVARWDGSPLASAFSWFEAIPGEGKVDLRWETAPETQNGVFRIFHAPDARHWDQVGQVPYGYSPEYAYSFLHEPTGTGVHFYHIESLGEDGQTSYTHVEEVWFTAADKVSAYPNPTSRWVTFTHPDAPPYSADLLDVSGRQVASLWLISRQLDLHHFPDGSYFLRISGSKQEIILPVVKKSHK
jgi:hypothetical protein